jgi:hypothetical protein
LSMPAAASHGLPGRIGRHDAVGANSHSQFSEPDAAADDLQSFLWRESRQTSEALENALKTSKLKRPISKFFQTILWRK